ncbi:MAG: hypothetical protein ACO35C_08125, partial [Pontimonas sp.]
FVVALDALDDGGAGKCLHDPNPTKHCLIYLAKLPRFPVAPVIPVSCARWAVSRDPESVDVNGVLVRIFHRIGQKRAPDFEAIEIRVVSNWPQARAVGFSSLAGAALGAT